MHVISVKFPQEVWMWTEQTERALASLYDSSQRGRPCHQMSKIIVVSKQKWGLTSRMRDVQDVMLTGMVNNQTVVYGVAGSSRCPKKKSDDRFMFCFFKKFSQCITKPDFICKTKGRPCVVASDKIWLSPGLDRIWRHVESNGLFAQSFPTPEPVCRSNKHLCKPPPPPLKPGASEQEKELFALQERKRLKLYECREGEFPAERRPLQQRLSVLRTLLIKHVFQPSGEVLERLAEMRQLMGRVPKPMLLVHARRTDKRSDNSIDRMMPQELMANHSETLVILRKLITATERLSGVKFKSLYFLSDDAHLSADTEAVESLSEAGALRPRVFRTPFNISRLLNVKYFTLGASYLDPSNKVELNLFLLAEVLWAVEHGMYVVGNGRSGVSQLMVQLLGAKYRMDPNWLGLWEDDQSMLSCLDETRDIPWIVESSG